MIKLILMYNIIQWKSQAMISHYLVSPFIALWELLFIIHTTNVDVLRFRK